MGTAQTQPSQPFRQAPPSTHWNPQLDLFGLYIGTPLTERSQDGILTEPDVIYVYRMPPPRAWPAR